MKFWSWKMFVLVLKFMVLLYLMYYLYQHFFVNKFFWTSIQLQLASGLEVSKLPYLIFAVVLLPVNWLLEVYKWHLLQYSTLQLSFYQSWKNVMKGVSFGLIMPQQLGDAIGKMEQSTSKDRWDIGILSLFGGFVQSFMALMGGVVGVAFLFENELGIAMVSIMTMGMVVVMGCIFYSVEILQILQSIFLFKFLTSLNFKVTKIILLKVVVLSLLRYLVFVSQFVLVLHLFANSYDKMKVISAVMLTYFGKTFIPALNVFGDLGIREFSALWSFSYTSIAASTVFLCSMLVWILNILLPMLLGAYYLLETYFSNSKQG